MANDENRNGTQKTQNKNQGNFANDPQKTSEAGKKGGQHSQCGGSAENAGGNRNQPGSRNDQNR
ncbi:MAG TPA: KGG domain-containing protein [Rhizomicrobium sp.]|jgi:hypothetical protein